MKDNFILNKIQIERAELNEKIEKIRSFLDGKNRKLISPIQELLLTLQLDSMKTYFDILTYRIICLGNEYNEYINKDITSDYLSSLSPCSSDLNLIKEKDYSNVLKSKMKILSKMLKPLMNLSQNLQQVNIV